MNEQKLVYGKDYQHYLQWQNVVDRRQYFGNKNYLSSGSETKERKALSRLWRHTKKFFDFTSLHGFRFLSENVLVERVFWSAALLIIYTLCTFLVTESVETWLSHPAIMSMDSKRTTIGLIPFPAVTICSSNQIKPSVFNYSQALKNDDRDHDSVYSEKIDYATVVCEEEFLSREFYKENQEFLEGKTFEYMINNAHVKCEKMFQFVKWTNLTLENACTDYMQPVLTEMGLCYSFNMLPLRTILSNSYYQVMRSIEASWLRNKRPNRKTPNWNSKDGYVGAFDPMNDIPRRVAGVGSQHSLFLLLDLQADDLDESCSKGAKGFIIMLHNPAEIPVITNIQVGANEGSTQKVVVEPLKTSTSDAIKSWSWEDRGCYYERERSLKYFTWYSRQNCYQECESNYSLISCGCVAYYHPRSKNTPICGPALMDCIEDSLVKYEEQQLMTGGNVESCNCLPSCTTYEYKSNVMSINSRPRANSSPNETLSFSGNNSSVLTTIKISFAARDTLGTVRVPLYTFAQFLGNVGGIMGLFLGFSWISILELFYFFVIRPFTSNNEDSHKGNKVEDGGENEGNNM